MRAFERLRVPVSSTLSHATVIRLGQLVGAATAVVGSVQVTGQDLIVRARSIRIDAGRMAPEIVESGPLADVFAIYGRVARRLAFATCRATLSPLRVTSRRGSDRRRQATERP